MDDCTESTITTTATLEVTKVATVQDVNGNSQNDPGDIINYNIRVENKGNVTLSGLVLSENFDDGNGSTVQLNHNPIFQSSSLGSAAGSLKVAEVAIYTASYTITAPVANTGSVSNSLQRQLTHQVIAEM